VVNLPPAISRTRYGFGLGTLHSTLHRGSHGEAKNKVFLSNLGFFLVLVGFGSFCLFWLNSSIFDIAKSIWELEHLGDAVGLCFGLCFAAQLGSRQRRHAELVHDFECQLVRLHHGCEPRIQATSDDSAAAGVHALGCNLTRRQFTGKHGQCQRITATRQALIL